MFGEDSMNLQTRDIDNGSIFQPPVPTLAENLLWHILTSGRLRRWRFIRKFPVGPYLADFACRERNVLIEVDGEFALQRAILDRTRDEYLMHAGFSLFRVPVTDLEADRSAVQTALLAILENRLEDFVEPPRQDRSGLKP
jgi:very-short-patch-repair endonuclease